MTRELEDTAEFPVVGEAEQSSFFVTDAPSLSVEIGGVTHPGRLRTENQDHFLAARRSRTQRVIASSLPDESLDPLDDEAYTLLVADGIASSTFGELASRLVATKVWELSGQATSWLMRLPGATSTDPQRRIERYATEIQQMFAEYSASLGGDPSLGTTCTCAYLMNRDLVVAHIGDSRAYLLRDGELHQLTRDHTYAQALIDRGASAADVRGYQHLLTRALGTDGGDARFDVTLVQLEPGDRLLLCSDGLTREVSDEDIARIVAAADTAQSACDRLLSSALDHGGRDNVTIVVAILEEPAD